MKLTVDNLDSSSSCDVSEASQTVNQKLELEQKPDQNPEQNLPEYVKEHNTTLSFPEKLMFMLTYAEKIASESEGSAVPAIGWTSNGCAFVIAEKESLVNNVLPLFFGKGKYTSFTRKLHRWGFHQVSVSYDPVRRKEMIFGQEHFQRDNKALMSKMRSVTAAGRRRANKKLYDEITSKQFYGDVPSMHQVQKNRMSGSQNGAFHDEDYHSAKRQALMSPDNPNIPSISSRCLDMSSSEMNRPTLRGLLSTVPNSSASGVLTSNDMSLFPQSNFNNISLPTACISEDMSSGGSLKSRDTLLQVLHRVQDDDVCMHEKTSREDKEKEVDAHTEKLIALNNSILAMAQN